MTHFHHAECLADFGYLRLAVESSKRTIEHDDASHTRDPLNAHADETTTSAVPR